MKRLVLALLCAVACNQAFADSGHSHVDGDFYDLVEVNHCFRPITGKTIDWLICYRRSKESGNYVIHAYHKLENARRIDEKEQAQWNERYHNWVSAEGNPTPIYPGVFIGHDRIPKKQPNGFYEATYMYGNNIHRLQAADVTETWTDYDRLVDECGQFPDVAGPSFTYAKSVVRDMAAILKIQIATGQTNYDTCKLPEMQGPLQVLK